MFLVTFLADFRYKEGLNHDKLVERALYLGALYLITNLFRYPEVYFNTKLFSRTPIQFSSVACDEWVSKKIEVTRVLLL